MFSNNLIRGETCTLEHKQDVTVEVVTASDEVVSVRLVPASPLRIWTLCGSATESITTQKGKSASAGVASASFQGRVLW